MSMLACYACGRQVYTVTPLESLLADERGCPRCGADLNVERRSEERRSAERRAGIRGRSIVTGERRKADRRATTRRRPGDAPGSRGSGVGRR